MLLGIDFGTTRTVVACCDRGNYPIVSFQDDAGNAVDWFPSVVAARGGELRFGFEALAAGADPAWTVLRSFKRLLSGPSVAPDPAVTLGDTTVGFGDLVAGFLAAVRDAVLSRSNLPASAARGELVAVVATPANAHGVQRFVTLDAFRRAGFTVAGIMNEPSAAGFEYSHRHPSTLGGRREHVVVYDLGGGTFDASLVHITGGEHDVVATAGSHRVGGDDFDAALVDLALESAGLARGGLPARELAALAEHCREVKERIHPNTRRVVVDLSAPLGALAPVPDAVVLVADYFARCTPLVAHTLETMAPVLARGGAAGTDALAEVAGIYVVGGASELPVVSRVLRDAFGRRVHRSPYPSGAVAIGLAIAADTRAGQRLTDRLSRHFGVFRESHGGREVVFDPIFDREARIPLADEAPVVHRRVYRAAHNVGRYRFVECGDLDARGAPLGDITAYADVLFPFDRALRDARELGDVPVRRLGSDGPLVAEEYTITPHGLVCLRIVDLETGFSRGYEVGA